jgi:prolipoprotein diacylglyceryl transferase
VTLPLLEIDIDLDPNLFTVGAFTLTWHGIFSVIGILATIRVAQILAARYDRISAERIYDAAFWAVVVGLLGARIHYVAENWKYFAANGWIRVLYVNEGGISQWGGIFGAMVGLVAWSRRPPRAVRVPDLQQQPESLKLTRWLVAEGDVVTRGEPVAELAAGDEAIEVHAPRDGRLIDIVPAGADVQPDDRLARVDTRVSFWKLLDAAGPAALLGLAIGRIGDVINGEHHGTETTVAWGFRYVNPHTLGQPDRVVHPEVVYEMILCLGLLAILMPLYGRMRRRFPDGIAGLIFLSLYALGRFWLSYFRADQIEYGLRQAQWASLAMIVVAVIAAPVLFRLRRGRGATAPVAAPPARA